MNKLKVRKAEQKRKTKASFTPRLLALFLFGRSAGEFSLLPQGLGFGIVCFGQLKTEGRNFLYLCGCFLFLLSLPMKIKMTQLNGEPWRPPRVFYSTRGSLENGSAISGFLGCPSEMNS